MTCLYHLCPHVAPAQALAQECAALVREGDVEEPYQWLRIVELGAIPELAAVARGIRRDRQAVEAARTEGWNNSQVDVMAN